MCGSMVDIQSPAAEIRRGKKDRKKEIRKERKIVTTGLGKNIMAPPFHRAAIISKIDTRIERLFKPIKCSESSGRPSSGLCHELH